MRPFPQRPTRRLSYECDRSLDEEAHHARGAAVIRYDGKRGVTWSVKYVDAAGKQVREHLGRAEDGWTKQRAERELGKRLGEVDKGYRKPSSMTFSAFSEKYLTEYLPGKGRKRSTVIDYTSTIRNHLEPAFGDVPLSRLSMQTDVFDHYVTRKMRDSLSAEDGQGPSRAAPQDVQRRPGVEVRHGEPD